MTIERNREAPHWHLSTRELVLIFAFWTSLAALSVLNRLMDPRGESLRVIARSGPIALPFVEAWLWALLTPLIFWLSSRSSAAMPRLVRIALLVAAGVVIAVLVSVVLDLARVEIFGVHRRGVTFAPLRGIGRFRFLNQVMVYGAVLAAGLAREYFLRDQQRQRDSVLLEARAVQLEGQLAVARLDALRMQIHPHFLFNTLNAISALVERDPAGVRRMIARLSDLLRHTLDVRGAKEVPLREEIAFLRRYLEIMEVRFQGRLQVEMDVESAALAALVPNFILQPIVENALEHGVSRATGEARIAIAARRDGDTLRLAVTDHGPGLDATVASEGGVGLSNTRARLAAMYGESAGIDVGGAPAGGVTAEIHLPWHEAHE